MTGHAVVSLGAHVDGSAEMRSRVTLGRTMFSLVAMAVGTDEPDEAADRLLERGLHAVIVKLGADGVMVATPQLRERLAPYPVEVVCGLGAGDAFGGAFCHGLIEGWPLPDVVRYGNAAGAIVAARMMCADEMPTGPEVDAFLEERSRA